MATFWKIEEAVGGGRYMVLEGILTTREAAEAAIVKHQHHDGMRAAMYETGGWRGGATRVEGGFEERQQQLAYRRTGR